jgi:hypothetical protein
MIQRLKLSDCGPGTGIPMPAPLEYSGKWVAWNQERTEIVARGDRFSDVLEAATAAGYSDAIFQKVMRPGPFIGPT